MINLAGKTALITGGGRGIGKEIALRIAQAGADVAICDIDIATAQATAKEIEALGRRSLPLCADVSKADDVGVMFSSFLQTFGRIDILVNNAGITRDSLIMRMKEEDWDLVLSVNLKSAFLCCKEAARPMIKNRCGKIVNIASVVGLMGNAGQANYAASKGGLISLTKTLARELAGRNIQVNAVAPGYIKTPMTDRLPEDVKLKFTEQIPMAAFGTPGQVADAVLFFCSALSDYITGQTLPVDGGLVM
jgi:3-oxoacyl-[acyl-carrier protein] reductase